MSEDASTRDRLVAEATRLLARSGYRSLGVNDLLQAAGATSGSLYHHFPGGKQELAATAIRQAGVATRELMNTLLATSEPGDAIRAMFAAAAAGIEASQWKLGCPVGTPAADAAAGGDEVAAAVEESFALWTEAIAGALLERGVDAATAQEMADWSIATYEGAVLLCRARRDPAVLHAAAERLAVEVERLV